MYQSFPHDQYDTYYYSIMNNSLDDCNSPEFRSRSRTWGGNEVYFREKLQDHSPTQQYTCFDSFNSNEDSISESINDVHDIKSEFQQQGNVAKKTSRKNPWGQETYADLIESAINSYPTKMATLQQIYDHISKNYKYFMDRSDTASSAGWKNSIRHNLSLHDKFLKCPKKNENMKSSLWSINQNSYKRIRSNSMDIKKTSIELVSKRKQLKEQRRSSTNNSNILNESKRISITRLSKVENVLNSEDAAMRSLFNEETFIEKSPNFLEMNTDLKYLPPEISANTMSSQPENSLHKDLEKMGMNSMESNYNYDADCFDYDNPNFPNFYVAAMEYSKFVAELFNDDLE